MKLTSLALFGVALALGVSHAEAAKTDVVVLVNGDRMTGEVKELKAGRLEFSTDNLGTIYIEWDKIAAVTAAGEFQVELESGELLIGSLGAGPSPGQMTLTREAGPVVLDLPSIVWIVPVQLTFWSRLDGGVDFGASYAQASEITQFTLHSDAMLKRPRFWTGYDLDSMFTRQQAAENTARHSLGLNYYYLFARRWLGITQLGFERNRELGFDLRTSGSGAAGRFLVQNNRTVLAAGLGLQVNREVPVEGEASTNVAALLLIHYWTFFFDYPHTDVDARLTVLPDLTISGRVRVESDVRLSRELFKDFYLSLALSESYDNKSPTPGAATNDLAATVSLGWSF